MSLKRRLSKAEADKLLPVLEEFNGLASLWASLIKRRIEVREKHVKVMLDTFKIPIPTRQIAIDMVDIGKTTIRKSGGYTHNQKMAWEKEIPRVKGFVI